MQAYVEAAISTSTASEPFTIPRSCCNTASSPPGLVEWPSAALTQLSRTAHSPPGLQGLDIRCSMDTSKASLLASVLTCHTNLKFLSLPYLDFCSPDTITTATALCQAVSHLTSLTHLCLRFKRPCNAQLEARDEAVRHVLATAVTALSNLAYLGLHEYEQPPPSRSYHEHEGPSSQQTQPRAPTPSSDYTQKSLVLSACPAAHTPASPDPLIVALSTAPALTSLFISSGDYIELCNPTPCNGLRGPFFSLQRLVLVAERASSVHATLTPAYKRHLPATSMPALTSLVLSDRRAALSPEEASDIMSSAALQPALRSLTLSLPAPCASALLQLGTSIRLLPQLSHLSLHLDKNSTRHCVPIAAVRAVAEGIAHVTALSSLKLTVVTGLIEPTSDVAPPDDHIAPMLLTLSTLSRLQDLRVGVKNTSRLRRRAVEMNAWVSCAPLAVFRHLTRLDLVLGFDGMGAAKLHGQPDPLTALQHLTLKGFCSPVGGELAHTLAVCLAPLTGLTKLDLAVQPFDAALVAAVGRCASTMPRLQTVALTSTCMHDANMSRLWRYARPDWPYGLLELPAWGHYKIVAENDDVPEAVFEGVTRALVARGAEILDQCRSVRFASLAPSMVGVGECSERGSLDDGA